MTPLQTVTARQAAYDVGIIASILLKLGNCEPKSDIGPEVEWLAKQVRDASDLLNEIIG